MEDHIWMNFCLVENFTVGLFFWTAQYSSKYQICMLWIYIQENMNLALEIKGQVMEKVIIIKVIMNDELNFNEQVEKCIS